MPMLYEEEFYSCPAFWWGWYHVRITEEEIDFGFSSYCSRKIVPLNEIRKVTMLDWQDPLCNWGGYGIRFMIYPHFETGYVPRKGPAIRLEIAPVNEGDPNQIYIFVTSDAEKVKQLLLNPHGGDADVEKK